MTEFENQILREVKSVSARLRGIENALEIIMMERIKEDERRKH